MSESNILTGVQREYIERLVSEGMRLDGREFNEHRPLKITRSYLGTTNGSVKLSLGDTKVVVGIIITQEPPYPDQQDSGILTINTALNPIASPTFGMGAPTPEAIEIARVVDRAIRESQTVDLHELCIKEGELVWAVNIDIEVLDHCGNIIDASTIAVVSALDNAVVPGLAYDTKLDEPIHLKQHPISVTMVKIGGQLLVDPTLEEEMAADARITITIDDNGDIRAIQKGGTGGFTLDEIRNAMEIAGDVAERIREELMTLEDTVR